MLFQYSHVLNVVVDLSNMQKCLLRTLTVIYVNPSTGKTYDLFRYRKKPWTCLFINQLYSRYAYIAFRENSHLSMEAQLIRSHFLVYKNFMYSDEIIKKENKMLKTKSRMCIFSSDYANMMSLVTPGCFLLLRKSTRFSFLTWLVIILHANCVSNKSSTVSYSLY